MKVIAIVLVLLISSSFAIDLTGYKAVPQDQIKDLRRVLSDGIKACLKVALDTGRLGPSNYHLDKVNQFLYQDVSDGVDYYLSIYASDNNNADNSGTIEGLFSLKTNEKLHLLDYAIGEDWPVYVAPATEDASL